MMRDLFNNTVLAAVAFFISGLLGILVVPVIVKTWGLAAFGLIVLARLFIPQGFLGIADLGASEITTQAVARARVNGDWAAASQRVGFMFVTASGIGLLVGLSLYFSVPLWTRLFHVDAAHAAPFGHIIAVTAGAALFLFPALVAEGIVKGFERFAVLRVFEVCSTLTYVVGALTAAYLGTSFAVVAFMFLATVVGRFVLLGILAVAIARRHGLQLRFPAEAKARREMVRYAWIMTQARAIGTIQNQSMPPLIGILFGPSATALYDLLVRLPRFAKLSLAVLNTSLLPVSARIDEHGAEDRMRRLGRVALVLLPAVTVPPLFGAALLSKPIATLWIGPDLAALWPWMAIMFGVPMAAQYVGFGAVMMLARPEVQARLNRVAMLQIAAMAAVVLAFMGTLEERAFILAQILAAVVFLPAQLSILAREFGLRRSVPARTLAMQLAIMALPAALALLALRTFHLANALEIILSLALWCAAVWSLEYAFLLAPDSRSELARMARAVLAFGRRRRVREA